MGVKNGRLRWFLQVASMVAAVSVVAFAGVACSGKPKPPPCNPTTPWTPGSTVVASTTASGSTSAIAKVTKSPYTIEQFLSVHRSSSARALDGKRFVYLYDQPGTSQLYKSPEFTVDSSGALHESPSKQLTNFPDRVSSLRIAPDGAHAIFLKDQGGDENDQIHRLEIKSEKSVALTASPKIKHTLPSFDDGGAHIAFTSNARNGKDMDLWVEAFPGVEAKPAPAMEPPKDGAAKPPAKAPAKVTPFAELTGSFHVSDWRGNQILMVEARSNVDQDLWVIDAKTKVKKLLTKHTGDERWEAPRFSRDGKSIFALTDAGREYAALVALDPATGKRTKVVETTHDVTSFSMPHWRTGKKPTAPVDDILLYVLDVDGVEELFTLTLDGSRKEVKRASSGLKGVIGTVDVSPDGDAAFVSLESSRVPTEIFKLELEGGKTSRETFSDHAGVDEANLVDPELLTLVSFDGKPVSLFWYAKKPDVAVGGLPGAVEKMPVVIAVHGGPEAQAQPYFSPVTQYLVLSGYAVAAPNVRGSTGYGKAFEHLDDKDKREDSVHDLSAVGTFLASRPDVDGKRIALYGGSYGGYMVLAGLTLYPDQWAAGVDIVGIANFRTFLEQTAPYRRAIREAEYGSLDKDGALLDRISPIHKVDKIKAPLMVIHGTRDPRVPVGEAVQITDALKKRGLPVELMTFDDEGHGLAKLKNRLVAYPAMVDFLDKHLKGKK